MSRTIEHEAKEYLLRDFKHARYKFTDKDSTGQGFDLWVRDEQLGDNVKVELKATKGKYRRRSDIFQKLVFSAANEVDNFERGYTKVVRVFLGNTPPKVFLFDRSVLEHGAHFETEFRAKIVGGINYGKDNGNIPEIESEAKR